jgi:hypothetical protein
MSNASMSRSSVGEDLARNRTLSSRRGRLELEATSASPRAPTTRQGDPFVRLAMKVTRCDAAEHMKWGMWLKWSIGIAKPYPTLAFYSEHAVPITIHDFRRH